jgi:hypothetical protein
MHPLILETLTQALTTYITTPSRLLAANAALAAHGAIFRLRLVDEDAFFLSTLPEERNDNGRLEILSKVERDRLDWGKTREVSYFDIVFHFVIE